MSNVSYSSKSNATRAARASGLTDDQFTADKVEGGNSWMITLVKPAITESVSAMLRAKAWETDSEDYKEFLSDAQDTGVSRSLARRQWRKVHGAFA